MVESIFIEYKNFRKVSMAERDAVLEIIGSTRSWLILYEMQDILLTRLSSHGFATRITQFFNEINQ